MAIEPWFSPLSEGVVDSNDTSGIRVHEWEFYVAESYTCTFACNFQSDDNDSFGRIFFWWKINNLRKEVVFSK